VSEGGGRATVGVTAFASDADGSNNAVTYSLDDNAAELRCQFQRRRAVASASIYDGA